MAKIFISHSSLNKSFAFKLANDLTRFGHIPWLDAWDIKVGQCIPTRIAEGLEEVDYLILILTPAAVASGWVDREWKAKYWQEVEQERTVVLPVLLEQCEVPLLLKTRKYADFTGDHGHGLVELMGAIGPALISVGQKLEVQIPRTDAEIVELLQSVQDPSASVASCISKALSVARRLGNLDLEDFCRREMSGWPEVTPAKDVPEYRQIQAFVGFGVEINMNAFAWAGKTQNIWAYMSRDPDNFHPFNLFIHHPVSELEGNRSPNPDNKLMCVASRAGHFFPETSHPDAPAYIYARASDYSGIVTKIRSRLTQLLLKVLPSAPTV